MANLGDIGKVRLECLLSTAASVASGIQTAGVVVIMTFVAVRQTAVVIVVLFVASGGGGSQARPKVLADWRLPAGRGWRPRVEPHRVAK